MIRTVFILLAGAMLGVFGFVTGEWLDACLLSVAVVYSLYVFFDEENAREVRDRRRAARRIGCE